MPTRLLGGLAVSFEIRYARASRRCLSVREVARERLCLNWASASGAVSEMDCWLTEMAVDSQYSKS